ncbi:MAG: hypothetical protein ACD_44C00125G0010 [uncultured bacterium]|nr:MAG: hypothetical protein ACD_44C00125G0010 [uncultured bacterium]
MQFLSYDVKNYLSEIYTWEHACEGYSEERLATKMNFLIAEILLE